MTRKLFPLAILALIAVPLQLTAELTYSIVPPNVTGGFSEVLNAIAIGDTNLVAVGNNSKVLTASIMTDGTIDLFNPAAWSPNSVPSAGFTLKAATYGKGNFLVSGKNNVVFSSSDTATWTSKGNALGAGSTVEAEGLAFGTNNFVLVPATVDVRYSASFSSPWPAATITSAAFLESYRAATTFGPGRFALCGIQGVVRISGNDGQSWSATRPFDFAETNLLGIATDGISTLVCVGDGGKIVVSADSGAHWTKVSYANAALNNKTLYAVTYAGTNGFVAVGDQGIVITSMDKGQTWARQTNYLVGQLSTLSLLGNGPQTNMYSQFATNELALSGRIIRGAFHTFSSTSHLRNLVVLVGDNGTVVLGGEIPDVPTNPVSQTNYAGFISTNLAVTVPPLITADWYWQGPGNSLVLVASNTATYAPPPIPNWQGFSEYTSNYMVFARDTRTGFVSTNSALVVLTTRPRPLATNNYAATVCNGSDSTLQVDLFGVAPNWKLVWSDTTNETVTTPHWARTVFAAEITNRLDNCPTQYTFTVSQLFDKFNNVISSLSPYTYPNQLGDLTSTNVITVNPRPKATVLGTNTVCNGSPITFAVLLKGQAPWTVQLSDGSQLIVPAGNITNNGCLGWAAVTNVTRIPTNLLDNCAVTTNYFVLSVTDSSGCSGGQPGDITGSAKVTVNPRPKASVLGTNTVCNGQSFTFTITLQGQAPWTVQLSDGSQLVVPAGNITNNSCLGWAAVTNVTRIPTNLLDNCGVTTNYFVLSVTDASGCSGNQPGDIAGTAQVTVNPRPKTSVTGTNTVCNGQPFTFTINLKGQAPWTLQLSDGSQLVVPVGNVTNPGCLDWAAFTNVTRIPTNIFLNTSSVTNYFVVSVTDASACSGNTTGDTIGTAKVTVNPRPTATLVSTNLLNYLFSANICNYGTNYIITNILTGVGVWTVTWNDGFVQSANTTAGNSATLLRTVAPTNGFGANTFSNNIYYITSIVDTNSCLGNQPGDIRGTNTMVVNPRPTATLISTNLANYNFAATDCNYGTSYTITNILTGVGPWTVGWFSNGVVVPPQSVGNPGAGPYNYTVKVYPTNSFGANTPSNNIYYITSVQDANSCLGNQPGDIRGTNTMVINPRPTATLISTNLANYNFAATDCNYGTSYTITNILTGVGPWTVGWFSNGVVVPPQSVGNPGAGPYNYTVKVYPTNSFGANTPSNNIYYITSVQDANSCLGNQPGDIRGTNTMVVNPRPTAFVYGTNTVCNYGGNYIIQAQLTGLGPWVVTWWDNAVSNYNGTLAQRVVIPTNSLPNLPTNFIYWIKGVTNANTCFGNQPGDISGTNMVTVNPRPTAFVYGTNSICNGSAYTITAQLTGLTNWNVTWWDGAVSNYTATLGSNGTAQRDVYPTNLFADLATNYLFYISGVTNSDTCWGNQPGDVQGTNVVTVNATVTADPVLPQAACPGSNVTFTVTAHGTPANGFRFQWLTNGVPLANSDHYAGVTNSVLTITNVVAGVDDLTNYAVIVSNTNNCGIVTNCTSLAVSKEILVISPPQNAIACGAGKGSATLQVIASGSDLTYQWYRASNSIPTGVKLTDGIFFNHPSTTNDHLIVSGATNAILTLSTLYESKEYPARSGKYEYDGTNYTVVVMNSCGGMVTNTALLTITNEVVIDPIADQTNCLGDTAVFAATTRGNVGTYQWKFNGVNLTNNAKFAGVTNATLYITNVSFSDVKQYTLVIKALGGCFGTSGSSPNPDSDTNSASLVVLTNLSLAGPTNKVSCPGDTVVFSTASTGSNPAYQWYKGGNIMTGETNPILTLVNVGTNDVASYMVIVTNQCSIVGSNATLALVDCVVSISAVGTNVVLNWTNAGLQLNYTTNLNPPVIWTPVVPTNNPWTGSIPLLPPMEFFRLKVP